MFSNSTRQFVQQVLIACGLLLAILPLSNGDGGAGGNALATTLFPGIGKGGNGGGGAGQDGAQGYMIVSW